jgi:hypothetical protein
MSASEEDRIDLDETFKAIREYRQALEQKAKIFIRSTKATIAIREELQPGLSAPFAQKHGEWYAQIKQQLVDAGFSPTMEYSTVGGKEKPPEEKTHYAFAGAADGTSWATWFLFPGKTVVHGVILQSWMEDGSVYTTVSGLTDTGMPSPPTHIDTILPADVPVAAILEAHRGAIANSGSAPRAIPNADAYHAARDDLQRETGERRAAQGPALLAPRIRGYYKDKDVEEGEDVIAAILSHPEWWSGEATPAGQPPLARVPVRYLISRDPKTGRGHMTTFGLTAIGLRELQMKDVAANHCRAARFMMWVVAQKLARLAESAESRAAFEKALGGKVTVTEQDLPLGVPVLGLVRPAAPVSIEVGLQPEGFDDAGSSRGGLFSRFTKETPNQPLTLKPAHAAVGNKDVWLRTMTRKLGIEVPDALPFATKDEAMKAASELALRTLPDFQRRWQAGLPPDQAFVLKTGLTTRLGTKEYVWLSVDDWKGDTVVGKLHVQPQDVPELTLGQSIRVAVSDVFDRGLTSSTLGILEPALTDVVAQDYGLDV